MAENALKEAEAAKEKASKFLRQTEGKHRKKAEEDILISQKYLEKAVSATKRAKVAAEKALKALKEEEKEEEKEAKGWFSW